MSETLKTITFTGELHPGAELEAVVTGMAKRLRITPEQAHKIVDSGKPKNLKRGLTADKALAYQKVLEGLGLNTEIVDKAILTDPTPREEPASVEPAPEEPSAGEPSEIEEPGSEDIQPATVLVAGDSWFSPGILGRIIMIGVGLLVATSALIEALIVREETIPMDASTLEAGAWALGGVLSVALASYFLGWIVWLLGKRKPGGGQMVFCLMVLVLGAVAVWINAEKLLGKIERVADQRASIMEVQSEFVSMLSERSKAYNAAAEHLELNVGAISQPHHINEMRNALAVFRDASKRLAAVQLEGDKILAERLAGAGVQEQMLEQFLSGYRHSAGASQSFDAATRQYEAEVVDIWLNMLDLLESSWGRWEPVPQNSSIRTDDQALQQSYNALVERLGSAHRNAPQSSTG